MRRPVDSDAGLFIVGFGFFLLFVLVSLNISFLGPMLDAYERKSRRDLHPTPEEIIGGELCDICAAIEREERSNVIPFRRRSDDAG